MSTTSTPSAPDFAVELAAAKLAALRSLIEILNTTDDPVERRRIATAILKIPDPDAPSRAARSTRPAAPHDQPAEAPAPAQPPRLRLENALRALVEIDDDTFRKVICENAAHLPDLSPARFARILAGIAPSAPSPAPQACAASP